ncbi:MAG: peptidoglycan-binding domain-containing protein [Pseudomonadota bacterium]
MPIEAWAETTARFVRRTRRSVARRPLRAAIASSASVAVVMIGVNALWDQQSQHPAPLWGGDGAPIVATHAPSGGASSDGARVIDASAPEPDSLVQRVQESLSEAGYFDGAADGVLGDDTAIAIKSFEMERGLPVTGEPSLALLAAVSEPAPGLEETVVAAIAVEEPAAPAAPRTVSTVPQIQAALNATGYGPLEVDGVMGPRTRDALAQFARSRGLADEGMTPAVLRALGEAAP